MRRAVKAVVISLLLALAAGTWGYRSAQNAAAKAMHEDAVMSADTISLLVRNQRLMAHEVVKRVEPGALAQTATQAFDALGPLRRGVRAVIAVDAAGTIVADTRAGQPALGIDVSDRDYYARHRDGSALGPVIGPPVQSRTDGSWSLPISVAVRERDGTFTGIVGVSVGREYFGTLFRDLSSADTSVYLYHKEDGQLLSFAEPGRADAETATVAAALNSHRTDLPDGAFEYAYGGVRMASRNAPDGVFDVVVVRAQSALTRAALLSGAASAAIGFLVAMASGLVAWMRDLAFQREALAAQRNALLEARLRVATETARIGVWELDLSTGAVFWDDTMYRLYQISPHDLAETDKGWGNFIHPDDAKALEERFNHALSERESFNERFRIVTAKGEERVIRSACRIQYDAKGDPVRVIGVNQDVTEEDAREAALIAARDIAANARIAAEAARAAAANEALCDPLTGLANRRGLAGYLDDLQTRSDARARIGWLHVDLDKFKSINDRYGHATGDHLLRLVAEILRDAAGETGLAARLGGDEFAVVLPADKTGVAPCSETLKMLADRIVARCRAAQAHIGSALEAGASVGIASGLVAEAGRVAADADQALYAAKDAGRNTAVRATPALRAAASQRLEMAERLSKAIAQGRIGVAFQPQLRASDGQLHGVEALVRWRDPHLGNVPPDRFLPIAEEIGAIATLDRTVLRESLSVAESLAREGLVLPRLSVNVSARRLRDPALLNEIEALGASRPTALAFELLETIDFDAADEGADGVLAALRRGGVEIELDDFGSGRASLTTLLRLRPDRIKLDRRLIATVGSDVPGAHPLVRAITEMGRGLGLGMTAEGIETEEQARALAEMGCDVLQGYHIAPPLDAAALSDWMQARGDGGFAEARAAT
jgi:diguanylate cyclase (GGDEF)-like protein/PAS domain S-box-containing protein